jgi:hypothetical protein
MATEMLSLLAIRIPPKTKEAFEKRCAENCLNGPEILRRLVDAWTKDKVKLPPYQSGKKPS